ncbi:hypothetical protein A2783_00035 [Microgenomates group bacterium RIFCSPHIGHO2_01_FULL_45_11]|nr:MAG: hypothetical protein A2783_00035 [Microgenomates group bacterium RIFCSPHIGHO2_01_FULL_45_11]
MDTVNLRDVHTLPPEQLDLQNALHQERHLMQEVEVPIVTVSATFRKELADKYRSLVHTASDVVFSRAHYSMAEAVRQQAKLTKYTTHLTDPTNFVSYKDWSKVELTETAGQLTARYHLLKWLKDKIDTVVRSKLPVSEAIIEPLLYLTGKTEQPIICLHYEAGTILARAGKQVLQVVTDPQVRPQYLDCLLSKTDDSNLPVPKISYAVFDDRTKKELIKLAEELDKNIDDEAVVVTGSPVDPRITKLASLKREFIAEEPLRLVIATGGLGTNLDEIREILDQFRPLLAPPEKIRLFLYGGTHRDFRNFFEDFAATNNIRVGNLDDTGARIRILFEDSIIDANNNLIKYAFPWAQGFISKPSGDMAYDAAAAGCFLLFLKPWGVWEENVQRVFLRQGVGFDFKVNSSREHLIYLLNHGYLGRALTYAKKLPKIFSSGAANIISNQQRLVKKK